MLRGEFGLIVIGVSIFYSILDTFNGVTHFIPWYGLLGSIGFISLVLNRNKHYNLSTVLLLLLTNLLVYFFADVDHPHGGVYFFFTACSMAALILFSYYNRYLGIAFALLPLFSGYMAFSTDMNIIAAPARHYTGRGVVRSKMLWCSFILKTNTYTICSDYLAHNTQAR